MNRNRPPFVAILGAGGFAREVFWHLYDTYQNEYERLRQAGGLSASIVFVDDVTEVRELEFSVGRFRVVKDWTFDEPYQFVVGVGSPASKRILVERARSAHLEPLPTLVHPRALVQDARLGRGGIVTPGCVLTTNIVIGDYVILNLNSTVGHDSVIGDYCTINPGCSISGNTHLKEGVSLGTGTVTREGTIVESGVTAGAQAALVKDIREKDIVVVGAPARKLEPSRSR